MPDGLFWLVRVPEAAVQTRGGTVTVQLANVSETDQFTFFDPLPPSGNVAAVTSFTMTYTRSGTPRQVRPTSRDPKSPFNWAGEMWKAIGSVTFTAAYAEGSFSVQGSARSAPASAKSAGDFGEMGTESNGIFLHP